MKRLRGFAIVSAIFILVVLAALGAFILNISSSQQIGSALDVQGVRAYQAARAGVEWGLYRQLPLVRANPTETACNANGTFPVFGFTVTVTCDNPTTASTHGGPTVFTIFSTACSQPTTAGVCPNTSTGVDAPGPLYIERRLAVTF
jgi:MSHA biogenesis protein MshP